MEAGRPLHYTVTEADPGREGQAIRGKEQKPCSLNFVPVRAGPPLITKDGESLGPCSGSCQAGTAAGHRAVMGQP